eukprot:GEMP01065031.1.p1 GENE.GEMP01065031.1~~GEMP01065031.1.p1  ORF type:complete len:205 (+),score=44.71 GEMP01065031.1:138-752(+)
MDGDSLATGPIISASESGVAASTGTTTLAWAHEDFVKMRKKVLVGAKFLPEVPQNALKNLLPAVKESALTRRDARQKIHIHVLKVFETSVLAIVDRLKKLATDHLQTFHAAQVKFEEMDKKASLISDSLQIHQDEVRRLRQERSPKRPKNHRLLLRLEFAGAAKKARRTEINAKLQELDAAVTDLQKESRKQGALLRYLRPMYR